VHKYLRGILYNQCNNTHPHWRQQRNRQQQHGNSMVTMAMPVFLTQQQPTINIIISITQIVLTMVDDAVLLSLIVVLLLKGTIWLNMVST
jgi:hypothetical protein